VLVDQGKQRYNKVYSELQGRISNKTASANVW